MRIPIWGRKSRGEDWLSLGGGGGAGVGGISGKDSQRKWYLNGELRTGRTP